VHIYSPITYVRSSYFLGTIHENRGEMEKAREYYGRFYELWKDGDMDRERVEEAKRKLDLELISQDGQKRAKIGRSLRGRLIHQIHIEVFVVVSDSVTESRGKYQSIREVLVQKTGCS
jgi:hypothetical protein